MVSGGRMVSGTIFGPSYRLFLENKMVPDTILPAQCADHRSPSCFKVEPTPLNIVHAGVGILHSTDGAIMLESR